MLKSNIFFSFLIIALSCSLLHAGELPVSDDSYDDLISEIVLPFLGALKDGDVDSIKRYIAGDMYESKKVLLEQNKEYPEFLRNYYQGVEFFVEKASESGDYIIVDIEIEYPNGDYSSARLYLQQNNDITQNTSETEVWKIVDFINR